MLFKIFTILLFVNNCISVLALDYTGSKVYQIRTTNDEAIHKINEFMKTLNLDIWKPFNKIHKETDILVPSYLQNYLNLFLESVDAEYEILIEDVERAIQEEKKHLQLYADSPPDNFTSFLSFDQINEYLETLAKDYPDRVTLESIGKSYEGRDMKVIRISSNLSANDSRPAIFIDAGIHAREWIAPAVAVYTINQLVENEDNLGLLENVDWIILPSLNPDGYELSRTEDRYWRKTTSPNSLSFCSGTDANRNFDFHWMEVGASWFECDETYAGKEAFSEIESQNVKNFILANKDQIKLYLTLHSYGQYLLYPWGYTSDLPDNWEELQSLAEDVNTSISSLRGTKYTIGSSTNVLYAAAGGSDDWTKGVAGVELAYTIELPGGKWGFAPPATEILPVSTETFEGFKTYHKYIESKFASRN